MPTPGLPPPRDTVSWMLTVRGQDLPYTPVVTGYMIANTETAVWYTNTNRLTHKLIALIEGGWCRSGPL